MPTYYKITDLLGYSCHGDTGRWRPGRWRSVRGKLVPHYRGLHLYRVHDLATFVRVARIWEVDVAAEAEIIECDDFVVARCARPVRLVGEISSRTVVRWAHDCAERALPAFAEVYPADPRPRLALDAIRAYLAGDDVAAARAHAHAIGAHLDAGHAATRNAVRADTRDAINVADAATTAVYFAAACADDDAAARASCAAARAVCAARAAQMATRDADTAERKWQGHHLLSLSGVRCHQVATSAG